MTTSTTRLTIVLLALCLLLGVSFGSNGPAELQDATIAASSTGAATPEVRGLQAWWENAQSPGEEEEDDRDNNDRDKDRDDNDNDNDNNNNCASRNDRSRECGANDSFPRRCCGSLVCDGNRCVREGDVGVEEKEPAEEEVEPAKTCAALGERSQQCGSGANLPADCCGNMICNSDTNRCEAKECSDLGERSQECGGGGALPVTCCGNLVCNASNRCDEGEGEATPSRRRTPLIQSQLEAIPPLVPAMESAVLSAEQPTQLAQRRAGE